MPYECIPILSAQEAVFAALWTTPILPCIHILLLRVTKRSDKALIFMLLSFVFYTLGWFAIVHPMQFNGKISGEVLIAGLSTIGFFCLGYMEFFSMICRGFSLRIMVDVYLNKKLTLKQIIEQYGGQGTDWLLKKRIDGIQALDMVNVQDNVLSLKSPRGAFVGGMGLFVKNFLKMGSGG